MDEMKPYEEEYEKEKEEKEKKQVFDSEYVVVGGNVFQLKLKLKLWANNKDRLTNTSVVIPFKFLSILLSTFSRQKISGIIAR